MRWPLKHGPIALIDESVPVIVIAPQDELYDKTVSNMQEVAAREGKIVFVSDADLASASCAIQTVLPVPSVHPLQDAASSTRCRFSSSLITRRWARGD